MSFGAVRFRSAGDAALHSRQHTAKGENKHIDCRPLEQRFNNDPNNLLLLELAILTRLLIVVVLLAVKNVLALGELVVIFRLEVEEGRDAVGLRKERGESVRDPSRRGRGEGKTHLVPRRLRSRTVLLVVERRVNVVRIVRVVSDIKLIIPTPKDNILDIPLAKVLVLLLTLSLAPILTLPLTPTLIRTLPLHILPPTLLHRLLPRRAFKRRLGTDAVLTEVDLGHDEFETAVESEKRGLEGETLREGGVEGGEAVDEGGDLRHGE